ncbi:MAG: hypothetical protein M3092_10135 [Actinomycetia bacterium]|nr:hypothetical protein [Actinomycetes bacterium]
MFSSVVVRVVVFVSTMAFLLSAAPGMAGERSLGAVASEGVSQTATGVEGDPVADRLTVSVDKRGEGVYFNASDLIDGDISVETDEDGLVRAQGTGTLSPILGESAQFDVDVVRRGSHGRYQYIGFLRLEDGSYSLASRVHVRGVELTSSNTVVVEWVDRAKKLDISMTIEDFSALDSSDCPNSVSLGESPITDLLKTALGTAAKGATNAAVSDLFGWVISAAGIGGSDTGTQMAAELEVIESTLVDICNELAAIDSDLQALTCATDADWLAQPASTIDNWYETYWEWFQVTQEGGTLDISEVQSWVDDVLDPDDGVTEQLTLIHNLGTESISQGSIADCIESHSSVVGLPTAETLDDRPYYEDVVAPIQNWFYGYNTLGYMVYVEALHFTAWVNAGSPVGDDVLAEMSTVCYPGATDSNCILGATSYGDRFLPWIKDELAAGGAPYSTDEYVMVNGWSEGATGDGGWWLISTNLEAYSEAAGGDCSDPLTSSDLCGPLVGDVTFEIPSVQYGSYGTGGYGEWKSADAGRFDILLDGLDQSRINATTTAAGWLCNRTSGSTATTDCSISSRYSTDGQGLENADKILVFNEQATTSFGSPLAPVDVWCFMDGAITANYNRRPFCNSNDGQDRYAALVETHSFGTVPSTCSTEGGIDPTSWMDAAEWTRTNGPVSDRNFYEGDICVYGDIFPPLVFSSAPPQYGVVNATGPQSYHWPIMRWTDLTCTDAAGDGFAGLTAGSAFNPGGMPTLCGDDYVVWLAGVLPPDTP